MTTPADWQADREAWQLTSAQYDRYLRRIADLHHAQAERLQAHTDRRAGRWDLLSVVAVFVVVGVLTAAVVLS